MVALRLQGLYEVKALRDRTLVEVFSIYKDVCQLLRNLRGEGMNVLASGCKAARQSCRDWQMIGTDILNGIAVTFVVLIFSEKLPFML